SKILRKAEARIPKDVTARLGRQADERGVEVVRVQRLDGEPLALETSYVVGLGVGALLAADLAVESVYDVIERATGRPVIKAEEYLEPVVLDQFEAELLQTRPGTPAFHIERLTFNDEVRPFELRKSIVRGDRFRFFTELR